MNMIQRNILIVWITSAVVIAYNTNEPQCNCAVFKSPMPDKTHEAPLITKNPNFPIECQSSGRENCAKMCIALAEAAKDKAPSVLCDALGTTSEPFTPLVFSRACGDDAWTNTGLTSKFQVCCGDKLPVPCPDAPKPSIA